MKIRIITACHDASGCPDFAWTVVDVSKSEIDNGDHYETAETELKDRGYEGPFVHFDQDDAKKVPWLTAGVKQYLGVQDG